MDVGGKKRRKECVRENEDSVKGEEKGGIDGALFGGGRR